MQYLPTNIRRRILFLMPLNISNMTAGSDDINMHFLVVSDSKLIVFWNFMGENLYLSWKNPYS
jgi:hypothetical protein